MARFAGHIIGGFAVVAVYTAAVSFAPVEQFAEAAKLLYDWQALLAVFIIGLLFAIFPDVDTNSKAQDFFYGIIFILDVLLIFAGSMQAAAYLGLVALLPIISHHRGWTHSPWAAFLLPLPILVVPYLYNSSLLLVSAIFYGAALSGYLSHLLFDKRFFVVR